MYMKKKRIVAPNSGEGTDFDWRGKKLPDLAVSVFLIYRNPVAGMEY